MDINFVDGLTLQQAFDMAYVEDTDTVDIYIEPPDSGAITDEDSGEEDLGGLVDNLTGNQLNAPAEIHVVGRDNELKGTELIEAEKVNYAKINWIRGDLQECPQNFPDTDYEHYSTLTPAEIFQLIFDMELITFLVIESNNYSQYLNCPNPQISNEEMKCALAILILSGYNVMPGKKSYWETDGDMGNKMAIDSMRRDRFITICRFIHCADNNFIDKGDKFYKVRSFMDKIRERFLKHSVPENDMNYDESMVKYFGKHSCKQFIRGKPIRFGYKVWSLITKSGYLVSFPEHIWQSSCATYNNAR